MDTRGSPKDIGFLIRPSGGWSFMADESLVYESPVDGRSLDDNAGENDRQHHFHSRQRGPGVEEAEGRGRTFSFTRMDDDGDDEFADPAERPPPQGLGAHNQEFLHGGGARAAQGEVAFDPFSQVWTTAPFIFQANPPKKDAPKPFTFGRN